MWRRIREEGDKKEDTTAINDGEQITETKETVDFGPIDAFHLADLNVLRGRITKLLLNSPNHTHVTKDLVITLVSLTNFALTHHIHEPKGVQKPNQNRTSFLQHPVE